MRIGHVGDSFRDGGCAPLCRLHQQGGLSRRVLHTHRGNKLVAELGPLPVGKRLAELPGLFASLPKLSEIEATEFAEDIGSARAMLSAADVRDP